MPFLSEPPPLSVEPDLLSLLPELVVVVVVEPLLEEPLLPEDEEPPPSPDFGFVEL